MANKKELIKLKQKRKEAKDSLFRTAKYLQDITSCEVSDTLLSQLKIRHSNANAMFEQFREANIEICCLNENEIEDIEEIEKVYFEIQGKIDLISTSSLRQDMQTNVSPSNATAFSPTKLPNINIPSFDGKNLSEYKPFIDLFEAVVDKNSNLSNVERLFYLKSYLKGEALNLITNLPLINESYSEALAILKKRYDNEVMIVNSHVYGLLDIPPVQKGTTNAIREFVSKVKQSMGALKNLNQPVDSWDTIIVCILSRKLDQYTNKAFQIDRDNSKLASLNEFLTFLENRATALEALNLPEKSTKEKHKVTNLVVKRSDNKCIYCSVPNHKVYNCQKFKLIPIKERISFVDKNKLCHSCLNSHQGKCKLSLKCSTCHKEHNSLLHLDKQGDPARDDSNTSKVSCFSTKNFGNVILPTVKVQLKTSRSNYLMARGLLDTGSQTSFITTDMAKQLNLRIYDNPINIIGISSKKSSTCKSVDLKVRSLVYDFCLNVTCAVIDEITCELPQFSFESPVNIPDGVKLSDEDYNQPGKIDILFGADVFFQILLAGTIKVNKSQLVLQNTCFGYVVSGSLPNFKQNSSSNLSVIALHTAVQMEKLVSQFWEAEKVPEIYIEYPTEQEACEAIFQNSVKLENNKFEVDLPLKQPLDELNLGDTFSLALKRFENLEKRLKSDAELFMLYKNFINEYISLDHARVFDINNYNLQDGNVYFMSHHPVIRNDKKSNKLRVVFDGSMKVKNCNSINDVLHNGAVVQHDLFDILILFRTFKYVVLTDVRHMYRMILINPKYRQLQNILWRDDPNVPIQCLQLQTCTYGIKSSAFIATRCLVELAHIFEKEFPLASKAILENTYVDDVLAGANDLSSAKRLKDELINLLKRGSFELHKWCANHPDILYDIDKNLQHFTDIDFSKHHDFVMKTLGMSYDVCADIFKVNGPKEINFDSLTKRQVLSIICKIYDPLGFVAPIVVTAKLFMQKLWKLKLNWDDILPDDFLQEWKSFLNDLLNMEPINITRHLNLKNASIELVGYCDASSVAYGAVLYLRRITDRVTTTLICSKSRINPLSKDLTIPKLELNSAVLLATLTFKIFELLKTEHDVKVFLYSDSKIVLSWLQNEPVKLNPYVANRVSKIKNLSINFNWLYVNTAENPADCLSRGLNPKEIISNHLWFEGPQYLQNLDFEHNSPNITLVKIQPEKETFSCHNVAEQNTDFVRFSSLTKLKRTYAYVLRFIHNAKRYNAKLTGNLSIDELNAALNAIIKLEQNRLFRSDIKNLKNNLPVSPKLLSLNPFLDADNLLRVGGRLENSDIPYNQKHPIIIPKRSYLTDLIIRHEHVRLMHAGTKQVLSSLNMNYWLINGNSEIKRIIHKCVICFKNKARCSQQLMGSLPEKRVRSYRPFQNVGIDFCGPFSVKQSSLKRSVETKAYIALFVCFSVKAIHIELLSDLTTNCFIAAFKRFIARRGKPTSVYCDNGSTFKGANRQLKEFYQEYNSKIDKSYIEIFGSEENIKFNFIPCYSPVLGGIWEAGVKSVKYHIKRVIGLTKLNYEQFNTIIIQIEGILNSRPLTPISSDPTDLTYLTPAHFLIGTTLTTFPEPNITTIPQNRVKFWKLCTHMTQQFWSKWYKDYLVQLQNRPKWKNSLPNLKVNDLVLLKEDNLPCQKWPMARVIEVLPGKDGKIRVVKIRTSKGIHSRSVSKVALLPVETTC